MAKEKVLIIDDNPVVVRMNESLLISSGYEVINANDGLLGLEKARKEKPDIILLDLILPGMHGFDVCKKLKEDSETASIPIIIISASGLDDVIADEPMLKVDGFVAKPYGINELDEAIREVLDKNNQG